MKYGTIPGVDKPVSRIVCGTSMPVLDAAARSMYEGAPDFPQRLEAAFAHLDAMYAEGVNCFDCAHIYGEEPLGEWMAARGLRDRVVVLAKGAHHNRWRRRVTDFDILSDVHDSLAKLGVDRLDMFMLHRDDPAVPVGPIVDALNRCHDESKIGAFGGSNWSVERIEAANDYAEKHGLTPFTVSSPNFGLADQVADLWGEGSLSLSGPSNRAARQWYAEHHMPIFAYSSLGRGFFSGKVRSDAPETASQLLDEFAIRGYVCPENFERLRRCEILAKEMHTTVPTVAMAFIFNRPGLDVYALTGTAHVENLRVSIAASEMALSEEACRWLDLDPEQPDFR